MDVSCSFDFLTLRVNVILWHFMNVLFTIYLKDLVNGCISDSGLKLLLIFYSFFKLKYFDLYWALSIFF